MVTLSEAEALYPEQVWDAVEAIAVQNDATVFNRLHLKKHK